MQKVKNNGTLSEISNNLPGKLKFVSLNLPEHYSRVYGTINFIRAAVDQWLRL